MSKNANVMPTKAFFINMLTRDIALNDAILDLLDNCLDGVVRIKGADNKKIDREYYKGYSAKITISTNSFEIEDNCGGIPRKVAEDHAFRMGRDNNNTPENLPTVGIYGIGMKRAIFKIGREAVVTSAHSEGQFSVTIPKDWASESTWKFPINDITDGNVLDDNGTRIVIRELTAGVVAQWKNDALINLFVDSLVSEIKASYSLIIEKGFAISVNGKEIKPLSVQLLFSKKDKDGVGIKPYIFKKECDGVRIHLAVGLYAPPPTDDELDELSESKRSSSDAGWTIVCNDRVVLYNDRSHLTGWGEAGVPHYHTQFIGIRGIVIFESNDPEKLPMTTTKRGIDLSSPIYAGIKNHMRDGLKVFTNHTNRWKGRNDKEREHYKEVEDVSYSDIFDDNSKIPFKLKDGGEIFQPSLPKPPTDKDYAVIRFSRPKNEIDRIRRFFHPDVSIDVKPSKVGEECFDRVLKEVDGDK